MKQLKLVSILVAAVLSCTLLASAAGFNAGLTVDRSVGKISVTVQDSDVLHAEVPELAIPCDFQQAYVTLNGKVITSTLADGEIRFPVAKGGTYVIQQGNAPSQGGQGGGYTGDYDSGDSSSGNVSTETQKNPDGSSTVTTTDKTTGAVTETTRHPDGSSETVKTEKDGTVTTTERDGKGGETQTVEKPDGTAEVTAKDASGTQAETTIDKSGVQTSEVTVSAKAAKEAAASGQPVALPLPTATPASSSESASSVTVSLPAGVDSATVEIPVEGVTAGTVAVMVLPDGTEKVISATLPTEEGIVLPVPDGATVKIVDNSRDFGDVAENHVFNDAIAFASARGFIEGYANGNFSAGGSATANAVVTVISRILGNDFYGENAVTQATAWATEQNLTSGLDLQGNVTRSAYMVLLWRGAGNPTAESTDLAFPDAGSLNAEEQAAIAWAVEKGIIGGYEDGTVRPDAGISRGAMAAIAQRYLMSR